MEGKKYPPNGRWILRTLSGGLMSDLVFNGGESLKSMSSRQISTLPSQGNLESGLETNSLLFEISPSITHKPRFVQSGIGVSRLSINWGFLY